MDDIITGKWVKVGQECSYETEIFCIMNGLVAFRRTWNSLLRYPGCVEWLPVEEIGELIDGFTKV